MILDSTRRWLAAPAHLSRTLVDLAWPHGGQRSARRNALRAVLADTDRMLDRARARQALDAAIAAAAAQEAVAAR
jgi:sulfur relay (sulfurtransferase) DsrF/TusC family protein